MHRNPDLAVRVQAGRHFPRAATLGIILPPISELAKKTGDAGRGKKLFNGRAACFTCHQIGRTGRNIGPDLSAIGRKFDRTRLLDALLNPSSAIVFGYEAWVITRRNGQAVTGFIVGEGKTVLVRDIGGAQHAIEAQDIVSREPLGQSLMPPAASLGLSAQDLADLVEYLMAESRKQ